MFRKILLGLAVLLLIFQFIRPEKNISGDKSKDISTLYTVPDSVNLILERSCTDCHSNKTEYPWYAAVEPVGWWLGNHVKDGKRHFNLNNFSVLRVAVQKKKMEELMDQIKDDEMPLGSYTLIHRDAELSPADKQTLNSWCQQIIANLNAKYPPDSLVLKREKWH
jgi:hypothetical protein